MAEPARAVFLSYASQDAEAAQKIASALRAAHIEVFLDQTELRGGDAWDRKIRHEIQACALFIPVISAHTQERLEGYFRREWKLAIERTHDMAEQKPFLVPVVIDDTREPEAFVPDAFRALQWTRLPGGDTPPAFVERIRRLLSPELSTLSAMSGAAPRVSARVVSWWWSKPALLALAAIFVLAPLTYVIVEGLGVWKHLGASVDFNPPPHSIAVLPFVNMSGDKAQEYLSDGLAEELLNSLAEVNELQVAARTSAFSFKGDKVDVGTIARKLNVGALLEGSVRRSGNTVRVTAQLISAVTGFHLWSHTYDRDLGDVLNLETEIANAVASALKVQLLGNEAIKIELGGTRNPEAFDAYLRGRSAFIAAHDSQELHDAIADFTEAIGLDPNYALAFANRSLALSADAEEASNLRDSFDKAQSDARKALELAPDLAEGHLALGLYFENGLLDFTQANSEYERALALAPRNAQVLGFYSSFAAPMGRTEAAIAAARRAVVLDPLNRGMHIDLGQALYLARQNQEALSALQGALTLDPEHPSSYAFRGLAYYAMGDLKRARASFERKPDYYFNQTCLAIAYEKLGRHGAAESMLAKVKASTGDAAAYQYAEVYAQWGNIATALHWLDTAMRLRDPGLELLKTDPLLDPLRKEPRFQAVMRELKFP